MTAVQTLTKQDLQSVLSFDGKDDYIDLGKKPELKIQKDLTLSAWINASKNDKKWIGIISKVFDTGSTESGYAIMLDGKSGAYFGLKVPSSGMQYLSSGTNTIILNQWHHVACTYDGQIMKIYVDGVEKASQNLPDSNIDYEPENNLFIGINKDDNEFIPHQGKIAEVRIWNKVRSQDEIKQDMNHRLTGKEEGLMAYYPLDGDTLDYSSNNNDGTLHGGTWEKESLDFIQTQNVEIADIFYDGDFAIHKADQYVEIRNPNAVPVDISGWKIQSLVKDKEFTFPMETSLEANQTIRVYTNQYHAEYGGFTFNSHWGIWKKSGDTATLLDAEGNKVSNFSYDNN